MNLRRGPRLQVRRPSPTTVEFTVTTAPPASASVARRALVLATVAARAGLALAALLLLLLCSTSAPADDSTSALAAVYAHYRRHYHGYILSSLLLPPSTELPAAAVLLAPACVAALLLWAAVARVHASESLLVLRGLGVQTASAGATHLSAPRTRFIPTAKIRDVLINEAFRGFEVRYYLVVVVDGEDDVVVVFPHPAAPRHVVETSGGASAAVCSRATEAPGRRGSLSEVEGGAREKKLPV